MNHEIKEYYNQLSLAYKSDEWFYRQNEDRAHNAAIMLVMLENATEISMFCGEMSVFRKRFYEYINQAEPGLGDELRNSISEALLRFISDPNKKITIILEDFSDVYLSDLIIPKDKFLYSPSVKILSLPDDYIGKESIFHVTFTENEHMVRLEINKDSHEAICKIGGSLEQAPKTLANSFHALLKRALPLPA